MDEELLIPILMIVGGFCFLTLVAYYVYRKKQPLKDFSQNMGWHYSDDNLYSLPRIGGKYRDHLMEFFIEYREDDSGELGKHFSVLRLPFSDPVALQLDIKPMGFMTSPVIVFPDENFSKTYCVSGNDEETIRQILTKDIQQKIMKIKKFRLIINPYEATFEEMSFLTDIKRLKMILDCMIDIVERMNEVYTKR